MSRCSAPLSSKWIVGLGNPRAIRPARLRGRGFGISRRAAEKGSGSNRLVLELNQDCGSSPGTDGSREPIGFLKQPLPLLATNRRAELPLQGRLFPGGTDLPKTPPYGPLNEPIRLLRLGLAVSLNCNKRPLHDEPKSKRCSSRSRRQRRNLHGDR